MKIPAAIIGVTGYTGVELMRILADHPEVHIEAVLSRQNEGVPFSDLYPAFKGKVGNLLEKLDVPAVSKRVKVAFLCTPHGESMSLARAFREAGVRVLDLSADFRIRDPKVYGTWYEEHTEKDLLKEAVYGLPEFYGDQLKKADLVACPGCYPTSIILALAPLMKNKMVEPDDIICDVKSGTSGAGRSSKVTSLFCEVNESFRPYNVAKHRHTPEVEQELSSLVGSPVTVLFSPHLVPMDRGIMATTYAKPKGTWSTEELTELYSQFYGSSPFVQVLSPGQFPATKDVRGSNNCHVSVLSDPRTKRIVACSAIDNLTKGAAGQAVQAFNIMFGFNEKTGLDRMGLIP